MNSSNININTRFTTSGKIKLLQNGTDLIKYFRVGDSDANYKVEFPLPPGTINNSSGSVDGLYDTTKISSLLNYDNTNTKVKSILESDISIVNKLSKYNYVETTYYGDKIDLNDPILGNLTKTYKLPITDKEKINFRTSISGGGYLDTVISDFLTNEIVAINNPNYGFLIDGSGIKISFGDVDLYSTFSSDTLTNETTLTDNQPTIKNMFGNIALLFCDDIKKPSNLVNGSWATGHNSFKPFKNGGKLKYNFNKDKAVGYVLLDMGTVIITNKALIKKFSGEAVIGFSSISNDISQNINVTLDRNEFYVSTNSTFDMNDDVRISEIELLDKDMEVIAYSKFNGHLVKRKHEKVSININFNI